VDYHAKASLFVYQHRLMSSQYKAKTLHCLLCTGLQGNTNQHCCRESSARTLAGLRRCLYIFWSHAHIQNKENKESIWEIYGTKM